MIRAMALLVSDSSLDMGKTDDAAYLYTSDVTRALRVSAALEAGSVFVNTPFAVTTNTPFGGFKESGNGSRESGKAGLMAYLEAKTILIK